MPIQIAAQNIFASQYKQTVSTTVLSLVDFGFTVAQLRMARAAFITIETAAIRYGFGLHAVDGATGHIKDAGDEFIVEGVQNILGLQMLADTGTDAVVNVDLAR
jgi:hypothetical protein